ncbi:hypothetical protein HY484_00825 [Candidatus Woesearchaeota archaeon]|nr:hypothetical protein [Candidatus Woesearchaeota archaeon]
MKAVIFGAGNIGRGFLGLELFNSGYELFFVDAVESVVDELKNKKYFTIEYLDASHERRNINVADIFHVGDKDRIARQIRLSDLVVTAVGPANLEKVAPLIASGLDGTSGKIVIAAENVPDNTWFLRDAIKRIGDYDAVFPRCVVDRIAIFNAGITKIERDFEWVIEDFGKDLKIKGVEYANNLTKYLQRKLLVFNGSHAVLGFLGYSAGIDSPAVAMQEPRIAEIVVGVIKEAAHCVEKEYGLDSEKMQAYTKSVIKRFENVLIPDKTERLAKDPIRKLRERVVASAVLAHKHNLSTQYLEKGILAGLKYNNLNDKESVQLQEALKVKGLEFVLKEYCNLPSVHPLTKNILSAF